MEQLSLRDIAALKKEIFSSLHAERQTAVIRLMSLSSRPFLPLLYDVPVFMPVPFEVNPGDACLVVFADREIDAWLEGAGETKSGRMHSLSDGFAFIGFRRMHNAQ